MVQVGCWGSKQCWNKEVEFDFLTRRMDIGKSQGIGHAPPVVAESSAMELQRRVAVITSAVCSAVVLVVILIAACAVLTRRRRQRPEGHDSGADRRSTGEIQKSETVALSAWEKRPRADSSHRGSQCRESLYLPCPYATARLSQFSVDADPDGVHHSVSLAGNEHSYDVPIQVVSKLH
ncbi:hypothetical protein TNIN_316091 [Trichonephila inaurata madagascariensis]|uniref:Uncharacterized protein n=1 Tax=Trichonephila inaurata madagascariensis TaxID=2747483 RepID=A0A8X7CPZ1_9ARAC|nr:hypothetical protein TNIN_316091 [Trichonephila inaurata madagascariensis]